MADGRQAPRTGMDKVVRKVSNGARVSDVVLAIGFAVWAFYVGQAAGAWFWLLVASSAFCAFTAWMSPIEIIHATFRRRFVKGQEPSGR